jgi:hypothetical protein
MRFCAKTSWISALASYFLSQVWLGVSADGRELQPSSKERELATTVGKPTIVARAATSTLHVAARCRTA